MLKYKIVFISVLLLLNASFTVKAETRKKVVVIAVNTVSIDDFLSNDVLRNYASNGVVGLFNSRSNGVNNQYKPYMTIGSGQKGDAPFDCLESIKVDKNISKLYSDITLNSCSENNMVNLYINKLKEINSNTLYDAKPGKLGCILRANSIPTAYLGGFWYDNSIKSPAFFIAMDENGLVDYGDSSSLFINGKMDKSKTVEAFKKYVDVADFIVIELGEIESLYANKRLYSEEAYNIKKKTIINQCGEIINEITGYMSHEDMVLCIISPYASDITKKNTEHLSPVIIYDGGKTRGIATSSSTRREGIISATDFAPFILDCFGIKESTLSGHSIRNVYIDDSINYILKLNNTITSVSSSRAPVLKGFALLIILTLFFYIVVMLKDLKSCFTIISVIMEFCMIIPFVFLIEGALKITDTLYKTLFIMFLCLVITFIIEKFIKRESHKILTITFINGIAIIIDIMYGQYMLKYSIFSYDPVIGARYYGLGNEFLGVLVGCTLIFSGCFLGKKNRIENILTPFLLFVTLVIGLQMWGSNLGGFVTSVVSFIAFILIQHNCGIKKTMKLSIVLSFIFIFLYIIFNIFIKTNQSHIGNLFTQISANGIPYFINTVLRKINMALRLIRYTIWSKVLIALIIAGITAIVKPHEYINKLFAQYKGLKSAFISAIIASCIAVAINDSGIVTAAIIMLYTVFSMIILINSVCLKG